ncbi:MAG: hypothetical protein U0N20_06735 [Clostridium sp.]
MNEIDFNFYTLFISFVSICIATYSCYQTYKMFKIQTRPYVYLYLVSTKNATYIKIKNFGKSNAILKSFDTNVETDEYEFKTSTPFPYVGLTNITLVPNSSKIAKIDYEYLNKGNTITVYYVDDNGKQYHHTIELNTFKEYALVHEKDFDIIDY